VMTDGAPTVAEPFTVPADWDWDELFDYNNNGVADYYLSSGSSNYNTKMSTLVHAKLAVDAGWPTIPADAKFGEVSAVDVDAQGNVWVLHRAGRVWAEPFPKDPLLSLPCSSSPRMERLSPSGAQGCLSCRTVSRRP
ncbi:MAG: hypothetical protein HC774_06055, partial [Sphingomonadales bacterium]|nr:hypothetical protein [Sphingomonadales bacterium]